MKITFENNANFTNRVRTYESTQKETKVSSERSYIADISDIVKDNDAYKAKGLTMNDVMQEAQMIDVDAQVNYMAVMSHSMSGEDFGKMLEEGVNPNDTDVATTVTIMDKIKAELAKAGKTITGFNDNLDSDVLREITGSEAYTSHLINGLNKADLPITKDSIKEADDAVKKAMELTPLTDGELKYLVLNSMIPTIDNLYVAKHSGAIDANRQSMGYFLEGNGYYAKKAEEIDTTVINGQIEQLLKNAGIEVTKEAIEEASWLVEKGVPLTKESFLSLQANKEVKLPVSEKDAIDTVVTAMSEMKPAGKADLRGETNKYERAEALANQINAILSDPSTSVHDRRVLEETRLKMTAEVNVRLIESGFSLDTSNLEKLVESLKVAEEDIAKRYFPEEDTNKALESKALYDETLVRTKSLYEVPASTLGSVIFTRHESLTIETLSEEGIRHKNAYELAGAAYETLMTVPRADLGDNIKKAFANVDDILKDLGYETTDRNRRSVRILAYNHVAINEENIDRVVAADRTVNRVVERMTPTATLKMIRDGVNPLKTSMEELEVYLKNQDNTPEKEMETYSRYLYRLEQTKGITQEEREAYIGIYRMLRQIEKSDGAVVGSVLEAGKEISFANLLTAARTAKKAGMNILVDDNFGGLTDVVYPDKPIDVQVSSGEAGNREAYNQTLEDINTCIKEADDKEITEFLEKADLTATIPHIKEAIEGKVNSKKSWSKVTRFTSKELADDFEETVLDAFVGRDEALEVYEQKAQALKDNLSANLFDAATTHLDVQEMKSAHIFLSVAIGMAREETYEIPVSTDDGAAAIRLTIKHDGANKGNAYVTVPSKEYGDVSVSLDLKENKVSGYLIGSSKILGNIETLNETLNNAFKEDDISYTNLLYAKELKTNTQPREAEEIENTSTYKIYKAAKTVVEALRNIY